MMKLQDALGPRGDPSSLTDSVWPHSPPWAWGRPLPSPQGRPLLTHGHRAASLTPLGLGAAPSEPPGETPAHSRAPCGLTHPPSEPPGVSPALPPGRHCEDPTPPDHLAAPWGPRVPAGGWRLRTCELRGRGQ